MIKLLDESDKCKKNNCNCENINKYFSQDELNNLNGSAQQTKSKHEYLESYFKKWCEILVAAKNKKDEYIYENLFYVEPFSNAGIYKCGHEGSPLIALRQIKKMQLSERYTNRNIHFHLIFNDYDENKIIILKECVKSLGIEEFANGNYIKIEYYCQDANTFTNKILPPIVYKIKNKKVLFFIDPYKVANDTYSFRNLVSILNDKDTEIIFNHMVSDSVRNFVKHPKTYENFYEGLTVEKVNGFPNKSIDLNDYLIKKIKEEISLKSIYDCSFPMYTTRRGLLYFLVFFTHHEKGLEVLKESIWKISDGKLSHQNTKAESANKQLGLFDTTKIEQEISGIKIHKKIEELAVILKKEFAGKEVTIEEIEKFVLIKTIFLKTHIKRKSLIPMHEKGEIENLTKQGKKQYPAGTKIKFT